LQKNIQLRIFPAHIHNSGHIRQSICEQLGITEKELSGYHAIKQSIDARKSSVAYILQCNAFINEPFLPAASVSYIYPILKKDAKKVVIVGAGPAGLFAALRLLELGIRPIVLEQGKDVRARRRDLAKMNKEGVVNPQSNYCFGEGGAGTYSDGKLYTRSKKRGSVEKVLQQLVQFGADKQILIDAHPHIGTNKLPQIITSIREKIMACGGDIIFDKKVNDLHIKNGQVVSLQTSDGSVLEVDNMILATGHSASDMYELLHSKKIYIEFKPFALGVRVEHPQSIIDEIQYHSPTRHLNLPPASYKLVEQVDGKGVFSFCMCPGGIIAPAATAEGEIVVNGWSPSKRNNPFANSGMVVSIEESDVKQFVKHGPLAGLAYRQMVEQSASHFGGGALVAPAQRLLDFTQNKLSATLPSCSYIPGLQSSPLSKILPAPVFTRLQKAFIQFGHKIKGSHGAAYLSNEAVVVATESRTSAPVRIPRDKEKLHHIHLTNLYPCAEGAGYAGGIVSAAMDGEAIANQIFEKLK